MSDGRLPPDLERWWRRTEPTRGWKAPREDLVRRLLDLSDEPILARPSEVATGPADTGHRHDAPDSMRASEGQPAGNERWVSRSFPTGEIGCAIRRTGPGSTASVRGRVWLNGGGRCRVLLVQDDHVLDAASLEENEEFRFEEILRTGWNLEVHPEQGSPVRLEGLD
ncbi:MAG: hypothetical protein KC729_13280 [Candidatus Eisenbacteria bacterium]|uniref:Uncharacterized protein n=1 Tax=Eiseniibacteriota bacterium TaxID=2212470 RepID=A0A956LZK9_UNCEI|nr:hypothetical protein [Candidatus Eisenbacteria bacterium]